MFKIKIWLVLILSVSFLHLAPQEQDEFISKLTTNFQRYHETSQREKVYVQLNKTVFKPKEALWFKAYVVESLQHKPSDLSSDLTLKLLDESGRIVHKDRYAIKRGFAQGSFKIPKSMNEGIYTLVAYSNWMQNDEEKDLFHQRISIVNSLLPKFFINVELNESLYQSNDVVNAAIQIRTRKQKPVKNLEIEYEILLTNEILKKGKQETDKDGSTQIQFTLPQDLNNRFIVLKLKSKYKKDIETRAILIPTQETKINIAFFPEGGNLVDGIHTKVAFQAVDDMKNPMDISGVIVNQKGEVIANLKSNQRGIGQFSFIPSSQDTYEAQIIKADGQKQSYTLPAVIKNGISVSVDSVDHNFIYAKAVSDSPYPHKTYLVTRVGGSFNVTSEVISQDSRQMRIPITDFPMGIAQIAVFDSAGTPKAERLVFVNEHKFKILQMHPNKNDYRQKEEAYISIYVDDGVEIPDPIELCLSILPDNRLFSKTTSHMLSTFLLTSELKNNVINPNYYFENSFLSQSAFDSLLMTQSVRCFSWDKVINFKENSGAVSISEDDTKKENIQVDIEQNVENQINQLFTANRFDQIHNALELDRYKYLLNWNADSVVSMTKTIDERFSSSKRVYTKEEKEPQWKRNIEHIGVLEAIRMIKPYQNINGRIVFQGISSLNNVVGALIVVDGMKYGNDIRVLNAINPRNVENIQIHTSANEILRFDSFAGDGVIEISTKGSGIKGGIGISKFQEKQIKNPLWIPRLILDETGQIGFSYINPSKSLSLIGIAEGIDEEGNIVRGSFQYKIR